MGSRFARRCEAQVCEPQPRVFLRRYARQSVDPILRLEVGVSFLQDCKNVRAIFGGEVCEFFVLRLGVENRLDLLCDLGAKSGLELKECI